MDFKDLQKKDTKPFSGPSKSISNFNLKDILNNNNAQTAKEAMEQVSTSIKGAFQAIANIGKNQPQQANNPMAKSKSMTFSAAMNKLTQVVAPQKQDQMKKSPSSTLQKSPSNQTNLQKSANQNSLQKSTSTTLNNPASLQPNLASFKSLDSLKPQESIDTTSIGAALEQALSTNITDSNVSITLSAPSTNEKPTLLDVIKDEETIKTSLCTSVWKSQQNFVIRTDTSGQLKIWKIDINQEAENKDDNLFMFDNVATIEEKPVTIQEITTSTLASGWPDLKNMKNNKITASQFAIDTKDKTSKLIHGFADGHIAIMTSLSSEMPIVFKAHSLKVTSLLVLHDDDNDRSLLVSGSADFTVKVWDIVTGKQLAVFHYHSGVVNLLFTPPKTIRKKLQNCFCSVAEDRSVIIYSLKTLEVIHILGGHSSSVVSVYWRVDLDYLLVRCSDGSVCIWQISTGLLERRVFGKVAAELIERSEGPGSCRRPTVKISFSKQSAFAEQSKGFLESLSLTVSDTEPDVQLLMLSIRRLIGFMNSKKDLIRDTVLKKETKEKLPHSLISALAYTLQYGKHKNLALLRERLGISTPQPTPYIGLKGAGSTFSLIVPKASERSHPFIFSPVLSALHIISSISILNALSSIAELKKICQEIVQYYLHELPKDFEHYEDPSFLWCAQFLKDASKEIQTAARAVMGAVLQRMSVDMKKTLADKLCNTLWNCQSDLPTSARKQNVIVALAVLAYKVPDAIDNQKKSLIAAGLIEILENGGPQHTTAISLLGDGYSIWQHYIPDPATFCRELFQLSLPALTATDPKNFVDSVATDALQAFINMSAVDTRAYIEFINSIIVNAQQTSPQTLAAAITSIYPLVHKHPSCLVDHLVVITSLLLKVLDPHFPAIRDVCMPASTNILRYLVEVFPMVSFHQEKQKLAVGNHEGIVVIYDMRTASKWQLFEAHKSQAAAVAFSPNGELLATFAPKEFSCKVWSIDGSGVLNLLGVSSRAIRTFEVPSSKTVMKPDEVLKYVKLEWDSSKLLSLRSGKNANKISFSV
jgi:WD40 repeat protein